MKTNAYWMGRSIDEMSHDELIALIMILMKQLRWLNSPVNVYESDLDD